MPSGRPELKLDPAALRDLAFLATNEDQLPLVAKAAADAPSGRDFSTITKHVAGATGLPAADVERILQTLQNLSYLKTRMRLSYEELLDLITESFVQRCDAEDQDQLDSWRAARGAILVVLEAIGPDHPLQVARKAERLMYAHQNILIDARIITELRPVFNEAGDRIVQGIIANTLLIDYLDGGVSRSIEFGLDATDVAELRRISERAEGKAVAMKQSLSGLEWQTTIYPEEDKQ
jgi:hypothetical protein